MIALGACPEGLSGAQPCGDGPVFVGDLPLVRAPRPRPRGGRGRGCRRAPAASCLGPWRGKCLQRALADFLGDAARHFARACQNHE
eukprot:8801179-Pyramimonas_sp.AAC.1